MIFPRRTHRLSLIKLSAAAVIAASLAGGGAIAFAQGAAPVTEAGRVPSTDRVRLSGQVAEIFGSKFVLQDKTGRALIETGFDGRKDSLVKAGEAVGVEGFMGDGLVHACTLVFPDGRVVKLEGPPKPPAPPAPPTPPQPPVPVAGGPMPPPPPVPPVPPVPPLPPSPCDEV